MNPKIYICNDTCDVIEPNNSIMDVNELTEEIENKILCLVIVFRYVFYA